MSGQGGDAGATPLAREGFDHLRKLRQSDLIESTRWDARWGAAVTRGHHSDRGALTLTPVELGAEETLSLSFDAKAWIRGCGDFEGPENGYAADFLTVEVKGADGRWEAIDTFEYDVHAGRFVARDSDNSFGKGGYDRVAYDGLKGVDGEIEIRLVSALTAGDEYIKIDDLALSKVAAETAPAAPCRETTVDTLLHEDFEGIHRPEDSDDVAGHTDWRIRRGAAYSSDHEQGALTFAEMRLDGHDAGVFQFDVKVNDVGNFEASGRYADHILVQLRVDGGHWFTIDMLRRDGHSDRFKGDQSGQTFGDDGLTTLVYRNDDLPGGSETVQFRLVSKVTAGDEKIFVDNVKLTAEKTADCADCDREIAFDSLEKGEIVSDQFDHVTILAVSNRAAKTVRLEAEDMRDWGFRDAHARHASSDEIVKLKHWAHRGALWDRFDGHDGRYRLDITLQDETDGRSELWIRVGDETRKVTLDGDGDGRGDDHGRFSTVTVGEFDIHRHEKIEVHARRDGGEWVRLDKLTFTQLDAQPENRAMIFDTDHITGGDHDLRDGDGKVLIISEDGDSSDPDDEAKGGQIHFDFETDVTLETVDLVDPEEGGEVRLFDAAGDLIKAVAIPDVSNGDLVALALDASGVRKMVVAFNGSGAVDDICFAKDEAPAPAALGDRVFHDLNANGLQDMGEPGIPNAVVRLLDADGRPVLDGTGAAITTTTDDDGLYLFEGLAPGDYRVRFVAPAGFEGTSPRDAETDDTADSDGDPENGLITETVTLAAGDEDRTVDQGFFRLAELGDFVFLDENGDGVQSAGELGVGGVAVSLFRNGVDTGRTATTDAQGRYLFDGLTPGDYAVMFTAPDGFGFTTQDVEAAPGGDALDSDADPDTGMTASVTLASGDSDLSLDAGLVALNTPPTADGETAKLCADTATTIAVLEGDSDADGDPLTVTTINGEAFGADGAVTLSSGAIVRLGADGALTYDLTEAGDDFETLLIGEEAVDSFAYTVSDGRGGEATATVEVTVCGAVNTIETITARLPDIAAIDIDRTTVRGVVVDTKVTVDFAGRDDIDGEYAAYCIELPDPANEAPTDALVYSTYEALPSRLISGPDADIDNGDADTLERVNYLLNRDDLDSFSFVAIETALRALTTKEVDGASLTGSSALLYDDAIQNGDDFLPEAGDIVGVIFEPIDANGADNGQVYLIGVPFDLLAEDCLCA